jgi:hypothetical protein
MHLISCNTLNLAAQKQAENTSHLKGHIKVEALKVYGTFPIIRVNYPVFSLPVHLLEVMQPCRMSINFTQTVWKHEKLENCWIDFHEV